MGKRIGVKIEIAPKALSTVAQVDRYIAETEPAPPDAMLIFCLSAASDKKARKIFDGIGAPVGR